MKKKQRASISSVPKPDEEKELTFEKAMSIIAKAPKAEVDEKMKLFKKRKK